MENVCALRQASSLAMLDVTVVGSYLAAWVFDVARMPQNGETMAARAFRQVHGGKGANMAIAARRLGASARFVGCVGKDDFGRAARALFAAEGVVDDTSESSHLPTGAGVVISDATGESAIVVEPGANADMTAAWVQARSAAVQRSRVVLAPLEIPLAGALAAAAIARAVGAKMILNPAPAVALAGHSLRDVFALTPNETEARLCLGLALNDPTPDETLAVRLLALGPAHVIITRGPRGALWAGPHGVVAVPALRVNAIDTVGAGDAFNAGFAVGLSERQPLKESIALGVTAASLSTERRDTVSSYPYRAEVDARVGEILAAAP